VAGHQLEQLPGAVHLVVVHRGVVEHHADPSEVTARRIVNWIYAWQRIGTVRDELALTERIAAEARHVRETLTPERNHRTLELHALAIVGFAFEDAELLAFAIAELDRNLAEDFLPDGVHREWSTYYHMIALRSFAGLRENARRHGSRCPTGSTSACGARASSPCTADGPTARSRRFSDADTGVYRELLELLGAEPGGERSASFPDGGYFTQRSGWEEDARFLIFDCGPLGDGGHGHYDLLSVEVCAGGRPLIVDPGRFTYADDTSAAGSRDRRP
jgi:Heparinase II/III-like protein/Heparinase II/III N-terminus